MKRQSFLSVCLSGFLFLSGSELAYAQLTPASRVLNLAPDSPFRDPDIIYLEADELISNEAEQTLVAVGGVEGRYQDRTLRADKVTYYLEEGKVIASGNVMLINSDGSSQYAESIELSEELETGTAYNFTSRLPNGGITGAALAQRTENGIDLYNAYYTACEPCDENDDGPPSWQIKAKRVSQDTDKNLILYKDAVFELFGLPVFYTPYLAHPDPSQDRASGWLNPTGGYSSSRGAFIKAPYYLKLDDYSELTLKPHIFTNVNPLLEADYRRKFYSGEVNINGSVTYGSFFDRNGDIFTTESFSPTDQDLPIGKELHAHIYADGEFGITKNWDWGFTTQLTTDDIYTRRYDLGGPRRAGLYSGGPRRLISQIFALGQSDNFRIAASSYGFQSQRTNINQNADTLLYSISSEDDDRLPLIVPKLEASYHVNDPLLDGRLEFFGDFSMLTRDIGHDYTRGTAGASYNKTFILPGGIEAKPFGEARYDHFDLTPYDFDNDVDFDDVSFERATGQLGIDVRWPFMKSTGDVDIVIEPRVMVTESFGDGKIEQLRPDLDNDGIFDLDFLQDSIDIDFDHNLIWDPNKSTGYDLWQEGLRADVGGSISAFWGDNYSTLFLGQSFTDSATDVFDLESGITATELVIDPDTNEVEFDPNTGQALRQIIGKSDMVGQFELAFSDKFIFDTRFRYDDDDDKFRRLDTGFRYAGDILNLRARYYKIDRATLISEDGAPAEEITGSVGVNITDNWRVSYEATRDLDQDSTRRQSFAVGYSDCCSDFQIFYRKTNFTTNNVQDADTIGIRVNLRTLGAFSQDDDDDRF